jgi:histidinol-phosphate phosphatase family protein
VLPDRVDVVIPTIGRPALARLLDDLAEQFVPFRGRVVVVDDRLAPRPSTLPGHPDLDVLVVASGGQGPAFARNVGWTTTGSEWVAFVDDDVRLPPDWHGRLLADLRAVGADVGAVQARVRVALPAGRRPTDWERSVAGLATAPWITADLAVRRLALESVGGFDAGFRHAYREDSDLAVRLRRAGWTLRRGERESRHPVGTAPWWISVARQRGNADDARMLVRHGRDWRRMADAPRGTRRRHVAWCTAMAVAAFGPRRWRRPAGVLAAATWTSMTARRVLAGPATPGEVAAMAVTSLLIPPSAVAWWSIGLADALRHRHPRPEAAILFDRDGTLVEDVPFNGDPDAVRPVREAADAVARARSAGVPVGVVSNQSGVARGLVTADEVAAVNRRVDELLGPFDTWQWCPHGPDDGCHCRKPEPGMVLAAAADLGVGPSEVAVIGDIGSDVAAGLAAGARSVLVPTKATRRDEVDVAPVVMASVADAVELLLLGIEGRQGPSGSP